MKPQLLSLILLLGIVLSGCSSKHPVEPAGETSGTEPAFDPHPTDGPPNPNQDFTFVVEGREFTAPASVRITMHNQTARTLMYWPQCMPQYEEWRANGWAFPFRICLAYWPGELIGPGESRTFAFTFAQHGAFRAILPVSDDASSPQVEYRSSWWIVR